MNSGTDDVLSTRRGLVRVGTPCQIRAVYAAVHPEIYQCLRIPSSRNRVGQRPGHLRRESAGLLSGHRADTIGLQDIEVIVSNLDP